MRALEPLQRFRLPVPQHGDALIAAVRRSLELLDLAPDCLTLPLLAATYRAPLGDTNYSLSVDGVTGKGKTTFMALFQQHSGAGLDYEHLPAGFDSTANWLEAIAYCAKDNMVVVDDLVMRGSRSDVDRVNREADRFLRSQANRTGRGRCNANGTPRLARSSRCLPVCTQEDAPWGHSLNSRVFRLAVCNLDAPGGRHPLAGAVLPPSHDHASVMAAIRAVKRSLATVFPGQHDAIESHSCWPLIEAMALDPTYTERQRLVLLANPHHLSPSDLAFRKELIRAYRVGDLPPPQPGQRDPPVVMARPKALGSAGEAGPPVSPPVPHTPSG